MKNSEVVFSTSEINKTISEVVRTQRGGRDERREMEGQAHLLRFSNWLTRARMRASHLKSVFFPSLPSPWGKSIDSQTDKVKDVLGLLKWFSKSE